MRLAATPTLLAVALAASGARATDGLYLHAYGARSAGMGGATLASGDDALAQINNPASLSAAPKELALDLVYLRTDVHFENAGRYGPGVSGLAGTAFRNDEDASTDFKNFPFSDNNHFAPLLAGVYRFDESRAHMGPLRLRNLSFGASLYVVGGDAVRFELDHPVLGPRTRYRDNLVVSGASGTLSYRVNDWLAVGASVQGVGGRLRLQEPVAFPVSEIAVGTSAFLPAFGLSSYGGLFQAMGIDEGVSFNRFDHPGLALGVGGRFGVTLRPTSWLRVAVAYQTQRDMRFDGTMKLGFGAQIDQLRQIVLQNPQGLPFVSNLQDIVRFLGGALTPEAVDRSFQFLGIDPAQGFEQRYDTRIPLSLPRQVDVGIALQPSERLVPQRLQPEHQRPGRRHPGRVRAAARLEGPARVPVGHALRADAAPHRPDGLRLCHPSDPP